MGRNLSWRRRVEPSFHKTHETLTLWERASPNSIVVGGLSEENLRRDVTSVFSMVNVNEERCRYCSVIRRKQISVIRFVIVVYSSLINHKLVNKFTNLRTVIFLCEKELSRQGEKQVLINVILVHFIICYSCILFKFNVR